MIVTLKKQLRWLTLHMLAVAAVLAIMVAALAFPLSEEPAAQAEQVAVQPPLVRPAPGQPAPQNPDLDLNKCGATVAFVVDLSNSLSQADLENQKRTLREMVNSLEGAPYVFSLYTFASAAPAYGEGNQNLKSMSLRDPEDVKKLRGRIDSLFLPGDRFGATNWDQGLGQVADDIEGGTHYDTVYFITDGKPTFDRKGRNFWGNTTEQSEIDNAVEQKERFVKSKTQLIPIGVGSDIQDKRPQNIFEPSNYYDYYYKGYWRVARQLTAEEILRKIATAPEKTIISPDYERLVTDLQKNFVTGCLLVNKEIVDGDGAVIKPGDGWRFDLEGAAVTKKELVTNDRGVAAIAVGDFTQGKPEVTITEKQQDDFQLVEEGKGEITCKAFQAGGKSTDVASKKTKDGVQITLDPAKIISCTFSNVPKVPVEINKDVVTPNSVLSPTVNGRTFDLSYTCTYKGKEVAKKEEKGLFSGDRRQIGKLPLGTKCVVEESQPQVDQKLYTLKTTWATDNVESVSEASTSGNDRKIEFVVGKKAYEDKGQVSVVAKNTYEPVMRTIKLSKQIANRDKIPDSLLPKNYPVKYTCRYIPDRSQRPENGGKDQPLYVADGVAVVPLDGEVTIGPLPVGTECAFIEEGTQENPIAIDGYNLDPSWQSNVCVNAGEDASGLKNCQGNYFWLNPDGSTDPQAKAVNNYEPERGSIIIEKKVSGKDSDLGREREFIFDAVCSREGIEVFKKEGIKVAGGQSVRVDDIPVASTCTVHEHDVTVENATVKKAADAQVTVGPANEAPRKALMTNEFVRDQGPITIKKSVDVSQVLDAAKHAELKTGPFKVKAQCVVPMEDSPRSVEVTLTDGETQTLGNFPVGTECSLTEEYEVPDGVELEKDFSTNVATVKSKEGTSVDLKNVFSTPNGDLTISKKVAVLKEDVEDLDAYVPKTFNFDLTCTDGTNKSFSLKAEAEEVISGIKVGAECTLTEQDTQHSQEVIESTSMEGVDKSVTGKVMTFTIPEVGQAATIDVRNEYKPAMAKLTLNKKVNATYQGNGQQVPEDIISGLFADTKFQFSYTCSRGGKELLQSTAQIGRGESIEVEVPVNASCSFTESTVEIDGLEGPTLSLEGAGRLGGEKSDTISVDNIAANTTGTVMNNYKVKTGSFNLRKKVGGDGITEIDKDRKFNLSYTCTYRGKVLREGKMSIARFEQGSEHKVDNLPIGTECQVSEDLDDAQLPNHKLALTWAVTEDQDGNGTETSCTLAENCESAPGQNSAVIKISETENSSGAESNLQGTLVLWNSYTADRLKIQVTKQLTGDGPALASDEDFVFNLVCKDPRSERAITAQRTIKGAGNGLFNVADTQEQTPVEIPVGWSCLITEEQINRYDTDVNVSFEGAKLETPLTDTAGATGTFKIAGEPNSTQNVTVKNDYVRKRAQLRVATKYVGNQQGNVNEYLTNKETFGVSWRCEDQLTNQVYEGSLRVPADGKLIEILDKDGKRLPVSVECELTEDTSDKVPAEFANSVQSSHRVYASRNNEVFLDKPGSVTIKPVDLETDNVTDVVFENSYWMNTMAFSVQKHLEGPEGALGDKPQFHFTYRCELPLLPTQPVPEAFRAGAASPTGSQTVKGTFDIGHGQSWVAPGAPTGTRCWISEELTEEQRALLASKGLRLEQSTTQLFEATPTEQADESLEQQIAKAKRTPIAPNGEVELNAEQGGDVIYINSLYRTEGSILIEKVDAKGEPLKGSQFSIFRAEGDRPAGEPLFTDIAPESQKPISLAPGSYYLVETTPGEGAQLLPQSWRFNVTPTGEQSGDLRFTLEPQASDSGLITVKRKDDNDPTSAWVIQVANVKTGELPLTGRGGRKLFTIIPVVLLLIAGGIYAWRRRNE
ncbi:cell surface protein [Corynebacterium pseudotuberculosis]|uniref:DUF5979 domain-containing protein n=1 Tax=Corynebacterium pseudotuberculosis TaxID=1719 RepID=UPI0006550026|nr:DUF5979 domain-containing protein [Corynebacterium pseudotuberculosis]AKN59765.1 VWA domain-containing protein [Corynebacterium pseudotuberculosis 31]APB11681.1 cell surface protein [Corynebacterium pseudotuberculosis]APB13725.1 cell surface protein [Corynebacterium pseudotuberculosis]APB15768.1 cell surface protein [Corynebacterium pseudotuberculosis]APB17813.1 cell surface protein [Corynebacterium pseudotuberculosis]